MAAPILVVEDNPITRRLLRITMESGGYTVIEAPDGKTALDFIASHRPALVLQDLLLPDMDGFDLIRRLRELPGLAAVPVVAMSGFMPKQDENRIATAGFNGFLVKPIEPSRLLAFVETYLPAATRAQPRRGGTILVVDDDALQRKLLAVRLSQMGFTVVTAEDGEEAIEKAVSSPPDAIVSDVLMPKLDGFGLCGAVRRDPRLSHLPVILATSSYLEEEDRRLALRVGADAFVTRTPDFQAILDELLTRLRSPSRDAPPSAPQDEFVAEYNVRLIRQLERQASMNAGLSQRVSLQAAELAVLVGISEALSQRLDLETMMTETLGRCLDAGGISQGALFQLQEDGSLGPIASVGYGDPERLRSFFGQSRIFYQALESSEPLHVPSPRTDPETSRTLLEVAAASTALLVPIVFHEEPMGVLFLTSQTRDLTDDDWLPFVRAVAVQTGQAFALARAFSRVARSEQDLREAEARYRTLVEQVPAVIYTTTPDSVRAAIYVSPQIESLLGYTPDEWRGDGGLWVRRLHPDDRDRVVGEFARAAAAGRAVTSEYRLLARDEAVVWVRDSGQPVRNATGEALLFQGVIVDITAQKAAEGELKKQRDALLQSEKLAAMGTLLAGIAHELNNPLSVVLGQALLLQRALGDHPGRGRVEKISRSAERCARIVRNFLALARQHPPERQRVNVNQIVEEAVELVAYSLRVDGVSVTLDLARSLPALSADAHQLHQVLINLITNAHYALRGGPEPRVLTVVTRHEAVANRIVVEVGDTGPGMTPDVLQRIFDPFYTTKPAGQGTGLGLPLCRGIVESHGGVLTARSAPGQGSLFHIELPIEAPRAPDVERSRDSGVVPVGAHSILIVDDEPEVAAVLVDLLTPFGWIDSVGSGREAFQRLQLKAYDLILCDLRMPGLDGPGLYRECAQLDPGLPGRFLFMTGDSLGPEARSFLDLTGARCVAKPFDLEDVQRSVSEMLGTRGG